MAPRSFAGFCLCVVTLSPCQVLLGGGPWSGFFSAWPGGTVARAAGGLRFGVEIQEDFFVTAGQFGPLGAGRCDSVTYQRSSLWWAWAPLEPILFHILLL